MASSAELAESALETIGLIYDAALNPAGWQAVVKRLRCHASDACASLAIYDSGPGTIRPDIVIADGHSDAFIASYIARYGGVSPWAAAIPYLPSGKIVTGDDLASREDFTRSEFYNDWCRPQGIASMIGTVTVNEASRHFVVSLLHEHRSQEDVSALRRLFDILQPHLMRAADLHRQMGKLGAAQTLREAALDRLGTAVLAVRRDRSIAYANRAAETLLHSKTFFAGSQGKLRLKRPADDTDLALLLASAFSAAPAGGRGGMLRLEDDLGASCVLLVSPPQARRSLAEAEPDCALVFINQARRMALRPERLMQLYGLTAAEARLAAALANGAALEDLAERFGVRITTLRSQLSQVLAKTGTARQADLIRRIIGDLSGQIDIG